MDTNDSVRLLELQESLRQARFALENSRDEAQSWVKRSNLTRKVDLLSHLVLMESSN